MTMIMDGLDTLSQVALDQVNLTNLANLCFDYGAVSGGGRLPSESFDELNTPVTSNSDVSFFGCDLGPVPITATGKYLVHCKLECLCQGKPAQFTPVLRNDKPYGK